MGTPCESKVCAHPASVSILGSAGERGFSRDFVTDLPVPPQSHQVLGPRLLSLPMLSASRLLPAMALAACQGGGGPSEASGTGGATNITSAGGISASGGGAGSGGTLGSSAGASTGASSITASGGRTSTGGDSSSTGGGTSAGAVPAAKPALDPAARTPEGPSGGTSGGTTGGAAGCNPACAADQNCVNANCVCTDAAETNCGGSCVDLNDDPLNCGSCGNVCVSGSCLPGNGKGTCDCPSPYTQCGPECVDTYADAAHCGGCDIECGAPTPNCDLGNCSQ